MLIFSLKLKSLIKSLDPPGWELFSTLSSTSNELKCPVKDPANIVKDPFLLGMTTQELKEKILLELQWT